MKASHFVVEVKIGGHPILWHTVQDLREEHANLQFRT
jgi:hypothetical protein